MYFPHTISRTSLPSQQPLPYSKDDNDTEQRAMIGDVPAAQSTSLDRPSDLVSHVVFGMGPRFPNGKAMLDRYREAAGGLELQVLGDGVRGLKLDDFQEMAKKVPPGTPVILQIHGEMQEMMGHVLEMDERGNRIPTVEVMRACVQAGFSKVTLVGCYARRATGELCRDPDLTGQPGLSFRLDGGRRKFAQGDGSSAIVEQLSYYSDCYRNGEVPTDVKEVLHALVHTSHCLAIMQSHADPLSDATVAHFHKCNLQGIDRQIVMSRIEGLDVHYSSGQRAHDVERQLKDGLLNAVGEPLDDAQVAKLRNTALFRAASAGKIEVVDLLLQERDVNIDFRSEDGLTPLAVAAARGHFQVVKMLCEGRANPDIADELMWTPIHFAGQDGRLDIVKHLVNAGADINRQCVRGITPLAQTIGVGSVEVVGYLLDHGANVNVGLKDGTMPLWLAVERGDVSILKSLLKKQPAIDLGHADGSTPLSLAARRGRVDLVTVLLDAGANINEPDMAGCTPLFKAARNGHLDVVKLLLERKADPNVESEGVTAAEIAKILGFQEVANVLLNAS
ncbi:ankyrin repeat domain-containing protein [Variovorax sp. KK3]|uniref:ankyrin repeat domain-containing protein n=1 Tax=Variovorax sp. KK3 TaxID=1855728 RepID=UPI00097BF729|nr:ankyrin repeat domain-containing protein [Variovorax sp. KK3]